MEVIMQVEMLKVFEQPLVLHSEAVEQGNLVLNSHTKL